MSLTKYKILDLDVLIIQYYSVFLVFIPQINCNLLFNSNCTITEFNNRLAAVYKSAMWIRYLTEQQEKEIKKLYANLVSDKIVIPSIK